jgi:hypothetical protein
MMQIHKLLQDKIDYYVWHQKIIGTNKQIGKVFYGLMECNEGEFDISENFRFHSTWGANESQSLYIYKRNTKEMKIRLTDESLDNLIKLVGNINKLQNDPNATQEDFDNLLLKYI